MRQYEAETHYDTNGRIVFTPSNGLPGVGLPRKAIKGATSFTLMTPEGTKEGIALGWEDVHDLRQGITGRSPTTRTRMAPSSARWCTLRPSTAHNGSKTRGLLAANLKGCQ